MFHNVIESKLTSTSKTRRGINPATSKANAKVPVASQDDVETAMIAAKKVPVHWITLAFADRAKDILAFADAVEAEHQSFSDMLIRAQGKPVWMIPCMRTMFGSNIDADLL